MENLHLRRKCFTLVLGLLIILSPYVRAYPDNFQEAKKVAKTLWSSHRTFYCGCSYNQYGIIDFESCDYVPIDERKDKRITWEHVVPVSWFGRKLPCWDEGGCQLKNGKSFRGRECCRKMDKRFREMEADLHNLVPSIRSVNMARKNYVFGEYYSPQREKHYYHKCRIIIDDKYQVVEPCDEVKGAIARIHFYMSKKYDIPLTEQQKRLLTDWDKRFPAKEWEKTWNVNVAQIQGNLNEYVK